jgi:hypothetical protein
MDKARVELTFEFGQIDNRHMTVTIDEQVITPDRPYIVLDIDLPGTFCINYSGKNNQTDTKLDKSGNITADLYAKITSMKLNGFPVSEKYLYHTVRMHTTTGQVFTTCYAGFNGYMQFVFDQPTVFSQYILMNS